MQKTDIKNDVFAQLAAAHCGIDYADLEPPNYAQYEQIFVIPQIAKIYYDVENQYYAYAQQLINNEKLLIAQQGIEKAEFIAFDQNPILINYVKFDKQEVEINLLPKFLDMLKGDAKVIAEDLDKKRRTMERLMIKDKKQENVTLMNDREVVMLQGSVAQDKSKQGQILSIITEQRLKKQRMQEELLKDLELKQTRADLNKQRRIDQIQQKFILKNQQQLLVSSRVKEEPVLEYNPNKKYKNLDENTKMEVFQRIENGEQKVEHIKQEDLFKKYSISQTGTINYLQDSKYYEKYRTTKNFSPNTNVQEFIVQRKQYIKESEDERQTKLIQDDKQREETERKLDRSEDVQKMVQSHIEKTRHRLMPLFVKTADRIATAAIANEREEKRQARAFREQIQQKIRDEKKEEEMKEFAQKVEYQKQNEEFANQQRLQMMTFKEQKRREGIDAEKEDQELKQQLKEKEHKLKLEKLTRQSDYLKAQMVLHKVTSKKYKQLSTLLQEKLQEIEKIV